METYYGDDVNNNNSKYTSSISGSSWMRGGENYGEKPEQSRNMPSTRRDFGHGGSGQGNQRSQGGGYNQGGYNQGGYNQGGYNQGGYNQGGYNRGGYHQGSYNQGGRNEGGYNPVGYNQGPHDRQVSKPGYGHSGRTNSHPQPHGYGQNHVPLGHDVHGQVRGNNVGQGVENGPVHDQNGSYSQRQGYGRSQGPSQQQRHGHSNPSSRSTPSHLSQNYSKPPIYNHNQRYSPSTISGQSQGYGQNPGYGQIPGHSSQIPGHSSQIPGNSSQIPVHSSQIPGHSNQIPGHSSQIPGHSNQIPGHSSQIPGHSSQIPGHGQGQVYHVHGQGQRYGQVQPDSGSQIYGSMFPSTGSDGDNAKVKSNYTLKENYEGSDKKRVQNETNTKNNDGEIITKATNRNSNIGGKHDITGKNATNAAHTGAYMNGLPPHNKVAKINKDAAVVPDYFKDENRSDSDSDSFYSSVSYQEFKLDSDAEKKGYGADKPTIDNVKAKLDDTVKPKSGNVNNIVSTNQLKNSIESKNNNYKLANVDEVKKSDDTPINYMIPDKSKNNNKHGTLDTMQNNHTTINANVPGKSENDYNQVNSGTKEEKTIQTSAPNNNTDRKRTDARVQFQISEDPLRKKDDGIVKTQATLSKPLVSTVPQVIRRSTRVDMKTGVYGTKEFCAQRILYFTEAMNPKERRYREILRKKNEFTVPKDDEIDETQPVQYRLRVVADYKKRFLRFVSGADDIESSSFDWVQGYFSWAFQTNFARLLMSQFMLYWFYVTFFGALIYAVAWYQPGCVLVNGDNFELAGDHFIDAFAISWTTFSTVGYGLAYPRVNREGEHNCIGVNVLTALEAFVGVLFAAMCSSVIFGKLVRIQSVANILFSDPMVIEYGTGVMEEEGDVLGTSESNLATKRYPCPILSFRVVNRDFKTESAEIINAAVAVIASTGEKQAVETLKMRAEQIRGEFRSKPRKNKTRDSTSSIVKSTSDSLQVATTSLVKHTSDTLQGAGKALFGKSNTSEKFKRNVLKVQTMNRMVSKQAKQGMTAIGLNKLNMQTMQTMMSPLSTRELPQKDKYASERHVIDQHPVRKVQSIREMEEESHQLDEEPSEDFSSDDGDDDSYNYGHGHGGQSRVRYRRSKNKRSVVRRSMGMSALESAALQRLAFIEEDSAEDSLVPRHLFSRIEVETDMHPFFKNVWVIRHRLDEHSPILSVTAKREIARNKGFWPQSLCSHEKVREHVRFHQIIINFTGTQNASGNTVYGVKVYDFVDVNVGYCFANMLHVDHNDGGRLSVDIDLLNDVRVQRGGGNEPLNQDSVCYDEDDNGSVDSFRNENDGEDLEQAKN